MNFIRFFVEEQSMEETLKKILPSIIPQEDDTHYQINSFRGKQNLLKNLSDRLNGLKNFLNNEAQKCVVVILIDRDNDSCIELKGKLEAICSEAGLSTKSSSNNHDFHILNRIVINELESWFFGDVIALNRAFPKIPTTIRNGARYRDPDNISGGSANALEKLLNSKGYYSEGMPKIEVARKISSHMDVNSNQSKSFRCFVEGVRAIFN